MESTLPPLFDHMDNVDISSPNDDTDIFKSAIQVLILEKKYCSLLSFIVITHWPYHSCSQKFLLSIDVKTKLKIAYMLFILTYN